MIGSASAEAYMVIALMTPPLNRPNSAETPDVVMVVFLQRVLDVERQRAPADVVLGDHAVDEHEVLRRDAARGIDELGNAGVARSGAQHAGGQRRRRFDAAVERQVVDQRGCLNVVAALTPAEEGVGDATRDGDSLRDAGDLHPGVERDGLRRP